MIKENQLLLNHVNMVLDGLLVFLCLPLSFLLRFTLLPGIVTVPLSHYVWGGLVLAPLHVLSYAFLDLYEPVRKKRLFQDLGRLFGANTVLFIGFQMVLFMSSRVNFSRIALMIDYLLVNLFTGGKRIMVRLALRRARGMGYNLKHILLVGDGPAAREYVDRLAAAPELGYHISGVVCDGRGLAGIATLGPTQRLGATLEQAQPDEVVCALEPWEYQLLPQVISACEKAGVKLSLVPFYVKYMPSNPQIDSVNGLPLINLRRIPLDNMGNAFLKRSVDIVGSLLLILLTSPLMLLTAIGVKCSSPGPVIFRQKRVGLGKKEFYMYKFRSMKMNDTSETAWSTDSDDRKTRFGSLIRKFSIDELPQFFNVLKGDMSLVGPRPELPFFVDQFKEEIPLYMVKHQVRPGITGWAQVNGFRGDTSIAGRIRCDLYYIENWTLLFDAKILLMTLFKGIKNQEELN